MIIQNPNKILRNKSREIPVSQIISSKIQAIIREIKTVLSSAKSHDGVALAAPQIGYNLRIFIIFYDLIDFSKGKDIKEKTGDKKEPDKFVVFINPEIIKRSKKNMVLAEGCLSVFGAQGKVKRSEKVTVRAYDEFGKEFAMPAVKILSQAVQHEIDHLDGILFIDKAMEIKKVN